MIYVRGDPNLASSWRPSTGDGGNPGAADQIPLQPGSDLIAYAIVSHEVAPDAAGAMEFRLTSVLGADAVIVQPEWSGDLVSWSADGFSLSSQIPAAEGTATNVWALDLPAGLEQVFVRCLLSLP